MERTLDRAGNSRYKDDVRGRLPLTLEKRLRGNIRLCTKRNGACKLEPTLDCHPWIWEHYSYGSLATTPGKKYSYFTSTYQNNHSYLLCRYLGRRDRNLLRHPSVAQPPEQIWFCAALPDLPSTTALRVARETSNK